MQMRNHTDIAEILNRMAARAVDLGRRVSGESELATSILVRLRRIAACIGRGDAAADDLVDDLIRDVNRLVTRSPEHSGFVVQMMTDLNELGLAAQTWPVPDNPTAEQDGGTTRRRRTGRGVQYFRRTGPEGKQVLVESRPDGQARDFYVRRSEYSRAMDAITRVAAEDAVKFPVIHEAYCGDGKSSVYPLRVLLRFWRSRLRPLIRRERSRYQILGSVTAFRAAAQEAWNALPQQ